MARMEKLLIAVILCCVEFSLGWECEPSNDCPIGCCCSRPEIKVTCAYIEKYDNLLNISKTIDPNATQLILSGNKLTEFNVSFNLPKLKKLDLNDNLLKTIPKDLNGQFPILDELLLDNNQITEASHYQFDGMDKLRKLSLKRNQLTLLNKGVFQDLTNLRQLLLNENTIHTLSVGAFQGLSNIVNLDVGKNFIIELEPGIFDHFNKTKIAINLSRNQIRVLRNGVLNTRKRNFEILGFQSNRISVIEDQVFQGMEINMLDLYNNSVIEIPPESLNNTNIEILVLSENKIRCSCELRSLFIGPDITIEKIYGSCSDQNQTLDLAQFLSSNISEDEVSKTFCTQCQINNTCLNGAVCNAIGKTSLKCGCVNDYYGESCENKPVCLSVECQHTGICSPLGDGSDYHCINCIDRYYGKRCELYQPKTGLNGAEIVAIIAGVVVFFILILVVYMFGENTFKEWKKKRNFRGQRMLENKEQKLTIFPKERTQDQRKDKYAAIWIDQRCYDRNKVI